MIGNSEIPDSWIQVSLGEIIEYGKTNKVEPTEIPDDAWILELEDIEKDTSKILQHLTFSQRQSKSTKNRFNRGDVLYGKLRPYLNKIVIADEDGYCTTEIIPLKSNVAIDGRFLFYWLKHPVFLSYVESVSHGLNMPRLGTEAGRQAPFILAPLNEQKRIADKLDRLLAKVDTCRERLDRISLVLNHFRQSILNAAISGKLSEDWRDEQGLSSNWQKVKLSEVATSRLGKMLDKIKNQGDLVPYLRNTNVRWFDFDLSDVKELRASKEELSSLFVRKGDVLICEGGEPGRCAIWKGEDNIYVYQKALHRVRVGDQLSQEWLCYCLKASADSGKLSNLFSGTTIKHLTSLAFKQFELDLPPIIEQHEIVRRVEKLFDFADRLEARYQTARAQIDKLTPALLDKAFKGELVPQDPTDEPASVLLAKIQQARAHPENQTVKQPKTPRKPSIPPVKMLTRSTIQPSHLADILKNSGSLTAEALWNASKLSIDDFYDQLKAEELQELLQEIQGELATSIRLLETI